MTGLDSGCMDTRLPNSALEPGLGCGTFTAASFQKYVEKEPHDYHNGLTASRHTSRKIKPQPRQPRNGWGYS